MRTATPLLTRLLTSIFFFLFTASIATASENESEIQQQAYQLHYPKIGYEQLKKALDKGEVFLIDANQTETYQKGHIPGAYSIKDPTTLTQHLPEISSFPIVVYCWSDRCSAWQKAADFAFINGYTSIFHFAGGVEEWKHQGNTLVSPNK